MGPECNRFHQHHLHIHQRNTFLPMLCSRPSIKDVILPIRCPGQSPAEASSSSSSPGAGDPLSPRISCIGQVKRNNRVIGFPSHRVLTTSTLTKNKNNSNSNNHNQIKYSKLKKFFSSKNLTAASSPVSGAGAGNGGRGRRVVLNGAKGNSRNGCNNENNCGSAEIDIESLDPPLPVIKRPEIGAGDGEGESLWKRRSGGVALKSLQLQRIHHPRHHLQPTTV